MNPLSPGPEGLPQPLLLFYSTGIVLCFVVAIVVNLGVVLNVLRASFLLLQTGPLNSKSVAKPPAAKNRIPKKR
jgi:hypothetical protein